MDCSLPGSCIHRILQARILEWSAIAFSVKISLVFPILLFSSISLHWPLRKVFLSLLDILWHSAFRQVYLSFSPLPLVSFLFSAICKASSGNHFALFQFFSLGMVLVATSYTKLWTSSIFLQVLCLSDLIPWIYFSFPLYNHKGFDLGHTWIV